MMKFPEILKMLREKQGYTQKQLAEVIHVTKNFVSHYELGGCMPGIDILAAIADVFDVSLDFLLGRSKANLSKRLLDKTVDKTTAGELLADILRLDKEHKHDLLKMLYYIKKDNTIQK